MTLPYVRTVEYLSPSSLFEIEERPLDFYLHRLGPEELKPKNEQTYPMAVGSAFDMEIKRRLGVVVPDSVSTADRPGEARTLGLQLADHYCGSQAFAILQRERPTISSRLARELWGIPISGEPDFVLRPRANRTEFIADWKVTSANRPGEMSPNKGYTRLFNTAEPDKTFGPHKDCSLPMDVLNPKWATQLAIYGWLIHGPVIRTRRVAIDQLVVWREGHVRIAQFRAVVTAAFQKSVRERLRAAWELIQEERVVPRDIADGGLDFVRVCA